MTEVAQPIQAMLASGDFDQVKQGLSLLAAMDADNFELFGKACSVDEDGELLIKESNPVARLVSASHRASAAIMVGAKLGVFESVETLKLLDLEGFNDLSLLESAPALRSFVYRSDRVGGYGKEDRVYGLAFFENSPELKKVVIDASIESGDWTALEFSSVTSLRLRTVADDSLTVLNAFTRLKTLKVKECHSLSRLGRLSFAESLESLALENCTGMKDLVDLGECKNLSHLTLRQLRDLPPEQLVHIGELPSLTELRVSGPASLTAPEAMLLPAPKLESLELGEDGIVGRGLLELLCSMPNLTSVEISDDLMLETRGDTQSLRWILRELPNVSYEKMGWRCWLALVELMVVVRHAETWNDARSRLMALFENSDFEAAIIQMNLRPTTNGLRFGSKLMRKAVTDVPELMQDNLQVYLAAINWRAQGTEVASLDLRGMHVTDITPLGVLPVLKTIEIDAPPLAFRVNPDDFPALEQLIVNKENDSGGSDAVDPARGAAEWLSRCRNAKESP